MKNIHTIAQQFNVKMQKQGKTYGIHLLNISFLQNNTQRSFFIKRDNINVMYVALHLGKIQVQIYFLPKCSVAYTTFISLFFDTYCMDLNTVFIFPYSIYQRRGHINVMYATIYIRYCFRKINDKQCTNSKKIRNCIFIYIHIQKEDMLFRKHTI